MLRKVGALYLFAFAVRSRCITASLCRGRSSRHPGRARELRARMRHARPPDGLSQAAQSAARPALRRHRHRVHAPRGDAWAALGLCLLPDDRRDRRLSATGADNRAGDVKPCAEQFRRSRRHRQRRAGRELHGHRNRACAPIWSICCSMPAGRSTTRSRSARATCSDWGVLTAWQQTFTRPITLRRHVDPLGANQDVRTMLQAGCRPLPSRDLQSARPAARPGAGGAPASGKALPGRPLSPPRPQRPRSPTSSRSAPPVQELAQRAIEQAKDEGNAKRFALGARAPPAAAPPIAPFKVLNPPAPEPPAPPVNNHRPPRSRPAAFQRRRLT